jgi:transcriptional regulator with XRE-family HTH domain
MPHQPAGDPEDIRLAVVFLRAFGRLDRTELATASGISRNSIGLYEEGSRTPSWRNFERIAVAVGYPLVLLDPLIALFRVLRLLAVSGQLETLAMLPRDADRLFESWIRSAGALYLTRRAAPRKEEDPQTACARLLALPAKLRRAAVPVVAGLRTRAVVEILYENSTRAAAHSADQARELAELALWVAGHLEETD